MAYCRNCYRDLCAGDDAYMFYDGSYYCQNCKDEFLESIKDKIKSDYEYDGTGENGELLYGAETIYHIVGHITDESKVYTSFEDFLADYGEEIAYEYLKEIYTEE